MACLPEAPFDKKTVFWKLHMNREHRLLLLIGLIQFINILDFMMVMPLGPDLALGLGIPVHLVGLVAGSYTLSAAVAGFIGLFFLDRFQRRPALLWALAGLVVATSAAALSWDLYSLIAARVMAGLCGGPLSAIALAIIADEIPPERRGAAMGKVMGAFAAASVIGVPFGLELSGHYGWHAPFMAFGVIGTVIWLYGFWRLVLVPRQIVVKTPGQILVDVKEIVTNRLTLGALAYTSLGMMASFMIVPNIAAHLQLNLGLPRADLAKLYLLGGIISFFSMRFAGRLTDRYSATTTCILFSVGFIFVLLGGFVFWQIGVPVVVLFLFFMVSTTGRNVAGQTLASKLPSPRHRAAFMSLNSAVTHCATSLGAMVSAMFLSEQSGHLVGIEKVATLSIVISLIVPWIFYYVERAYAKQ